MAGLDSCTSRGPWEILFVRSNRSAVHWTSCRPSADPLGSMCKFILNRAEISAYLRICFYRRSHPRRGVAMMRILYCNKYNYPFSGTEVYLFELMQMMREQGHEVALFSMADPRGGPLPYDQHFVPHLDFKNNNDGLFKRMRLALRTIYSRDARRRLGEMIEEFRPDIAHVRNIYHHLTPSILWELKRRNIPVLYHLNDFKLICPSYN